MQTATADLVRERTDAEVMRRCIRAGTMATAWARDPARYEAHRFARSISAVCDQIAADALAGVSNWYALEAPPRHGKSEHVGRVLPARVMALLPGASILYATSTDDRADDVSMAARSMVDRCAVAYPHLGRGETWQRTRFRTVGGGWWTGVGAGSATGGIGARLAVVDDVTGSAERQRSAAWKRGARRWLLEDVISRLENGPLVVMETRRGLDDVIGWLEGEFPGKLIRHTWRCLAEEGEQDGRAPGEYLWPERYGEAWRASSPHLYDQSPIWSSLYQQRPTREGGAVILEEWCGHRYPGSPMDARAACSAVYVVIDPAAKTSERNDPSAIGVLGVRGSDVLVLHVEAERRDYPALRQRAIDLARQWRSAGLVVEDTSVGQALVPDLRASGVAVHAQSVAGRGDKVARMQPFLIRWQSGQVLLPSSAPWVAAFVSEVVSVPDAAHDDQWDMMSLGLAYLAGQQLAAVRPFRVRGV